MMTADAWLTRRLLVPLDGSALAEQALAYAMALTGPATDIVLVHVISELEPRYDPDGQTLPPTGAGVNAGVTAATAALNDAVVEWGLPADRTHVEVVRSEPTTALLHIASVWKSTLMVLASHGRDIDAKWQYGGVSDRLVRRASIPVLVIRPDEQRVSPGERPARIARIVVPLDGSTRAERALPVAGELARQLQLPVKLVRVIAPPDTSEGLINDAPADGVPVHPQPQGRAEADVVAEARRHLEQAASHPALRGIATGIDVPVGDAARCLLELADPSDVLVLTSHGSGGIPQWLLGSVAEQVVRLAAAPVLVVPDDRRAEAEPDADDGCVSEGP